MFCNESRNAQKIKVLRKSLLALQEEVADLKKPKPYWPAFALGGGVLALAVLLFGKAFYDGLMSEEMAVAIITLLQISILVSSRDQTIRGLTISLLAILMTLSLTLNYLL